MTYTSGCPEAPVAEPEYVDAIANLCSSIFGPMAGQRVYLMAGWRKPFGGATPSNPVIKRQEGLLEEKQEEKPRKKESIPAYRKATDYRGVKTYPTFDEARAKAREEIREGKPVFVKKVEEAVPFLDLRRNDKERIMARIAGLKELCPRCRYETVILHRDIFIHETYKGEEVMCLKQICPNCLLWRYLTLPQLKPIVDETREDYRLRLIKPIFIQ